MKRNPFKGILFISILLFNVAFVNAQKVIKVTSKHVLIDKDTGIGKLGDIIKIHRLVNNKIIGVGYVKIVMFREGKTAAEIFDKIKGRSITVGDFVEGPDPKNRTISDLKPVLATKEKGVNRESILLDNDILIVKTGGSSFLGSGITEDDAKTLAINDAKRNALEYAGTYLESHTEVLNYQLVKDEIITFTGSLVKVRVLNERRMLVNNMFAFRVNIEATIDTRLLNQRIIEVRKNRDMLKQLEAERERNKRLEVRVAELQTSLSDVNKHEIKEIVNALSASDWLNKGFDTSDSQLKINYFTKAIELDPEYVLAYVFRGGAYSELSNHDEAAQDLTKAIELDPKNSMAYAHRGQSYIELGRQDEALNDVNKAIKLDPNYGLPRSLRGIIYDVLSRHDEAVREYNMAIQIDPNNAKFYYFLRGAAYIDLGRYDEAERNLTVAIELDSKNNLGYYKRGITYYCLERYDEAVRDFSVAIELNPNYAPAYYSRGMVYQAISSYDEALKDFSRAIELDPKYTLAYYNRGTVYTYLGRFDNVLRDLTAAIELDPMHIDSYVGRGLTYFRIGRHHDSIQDFTVAIQLDPKNSNAYSGRGAAYSYLDNHDKAVRDLTKAIELYSKNSFAFMYRGIEYSNVEKNKEAVDDWNEYLRIEGNETKITEKVRRMIRLLGYTPKY